MGFLDRSVRIPFRFGQRQYQPGPTSFGPGRRRKKLYERITHWFAPGAQHICSRTSRQTPNARAFGAVFLNMNEQTGAHASSIAIDDVNGLSANRIDVNQGVKDSSFMEIPE